MTEIKGIYPRDRPTAVSVEASLVGSPDAVAYIGANAHLDREGVIRLRDHLTVVLDRFDDAAKAAELARAAAAEAAPFKRGDIVAFKRAAFFSARIVVTDEDEAGRVDLVVLTNENPRTARNFGPGTLLPNRNHRNYRRLTAEELEAL